MKNPLKTIQTAARIAEIVSKVVMVCCIVGACSCVVGIGAYAFGAKIALDKAGVDVVGIVRTEAGLSTVQLYAAMILSAFALVCETVIAKFMVDYFKKEQADGTPFTDDGAETLFRLGIITAVISVVGNAVASIAFAAVKISDTMYNLDFGGSIGLGLFFIVLAVVCKYGASLNKAEKIEVEASQTPETAENND